MMNGIYLLIVNKDRDPMGVYTTRLEQVFTETGEKYVFFEQGNECPDNVKAAVVLGGDGTLIKAAADLKGRNIPILGINTGTLGYLTGAEERDLEKAVRALVKGEYRIEKRMMLDVNFNGKETVTVLNDAVFSRNGYSRIINLKVSINGIELFETAGDGVIVATPTGSTGYNLSAGGTICVPEAEMILVTPICPHNITSRPIIASSADEITIEVPETKYRNGVEIGVTLDGMLYTALKTGDRVTLRKSECYASLIRTDSRTFFEALKDKLS